MNTFRAVLFAVALASPLAVACGGSADDQQNDPTEEGDEQDVVSGRTVKVTEADNGKTITVKKGQSVMLTLPSNASTGYEWKVTRTDRSFGYPTSKYVAPSSSAVGAGGSQKLTWKTSGAFPGVGSHSVTLEYARAAGAAAKTFTFTVDIVDAAPAPAPSGAVQATEADDGKALDVATGNDIVLTLASNPTTGYGWHVTSTDRTFGYPKDEFIGPQSGAVGAGGSQKLTWKTSGPFPMTGTHKVQLAYSRGEAGTPAKTFTLVVNIQ